MAIRQYQISIIPLKNNQLPVGLHNSLQCAISEPSEFLPVGSSNMRGLVFLNEEGRQIENDITFYHSTFIPKKIEYMSELAEIQKIVFDRIYSSYQLSPQDIQVKVLPLIKQRF